MLDDRAAPPWPLRGFVFSAVLNKRSGSSMKNEMAVEGRAGMRARRALYGVRLAAVVLGLAAWFGTQAMIARKGFPENGIGDRVLIMTGGANQYLNAHPPAANALLISSSFLIDVLGIFILGYSIFGKSLRPFVGLLILFLLRQICQSLCSLPPPEGMIWRYPGFPSLLVTYGTSNDLFFSGHTAMAVFGSITIGRWLGRRFAVLAITIAVFEIVTVILLRAHYTMDVFTGMIAALWADGAAGWAGPVVDRVLGRGGGGDRESTRT